MRRRDFVAGAVLVNSVPHAIMGVAGKRMTTPLNGPNSGAVANVVWAGLNIFVCLVALAPSTWRSADQSVVEGRIRGITFGMAVMAAFASAYELSPGAARRRVVRSEVGVPNT